MSRQIANISLTSFAVGQGSKIPLGSVTPPPTIDQQMRPSQVLGSTLLLFNESGSGLTCTFPASLETFTLAAGAWKQIMVPPNEVELDFTVTYILNATPPVSQLLADLYLPGEAIDSVGVLGNSPISGATSLTTKIPINTTGGDIVGIEFGPDVHSASDWEIKCSQTGDIYLFDNKNARIVWVGQLADGRLSLPQGLTVNINTTGGTQLPITIADTHSGKSWSIEMDNTGNLILRDTTDGNQWVFGAPNGLTIFPAAIFQIAGQSTVGKYGVALQTGITRDLAVTSGAVTTIVTFTTPNDGINHIVRVWVQFWVGAGNTNPSAASVSSAWTDPIFGAVSPALMDNQTATIYNGVNRAQGSTYSAMPFQFEASPNTTVTLSYHNSAAGTISDKVTGTIELLA